MFRSPQVNLYTRDLPRSMAFYAHLGFRETFRYPKTGAPEHVEMVLDDFKIGIADADKAALNHGIPMDLDGHTTELVLWTDDTDGEFEKLVAAGATTLSQPHDWLHDLRLAWVTDPDGNPIQLVQKRR